MRRYLRWGALAFEACPSMPCTSGPTASRASRRSTRGSSSTPTCRTRTRPGRLRWCSTARRGSRSTRRDSAPTAGSCSCSSPRRCTPGWPRFRRGGRTRFCTSIRRCCMIGTRAIARLPERRAGSCSATARCETRCCVRTRRSRRVGSGSSSTKRCSERWRRCARTCDPVPLPTATAQSTRPCGGLGRICWSNGTSPCRWRRCRRSRACRGSSSCAASVATPASRRTHFRRTCESARRATCWPGARPRRWVAAQCGFADQSHLTRTFKRAVGVTPARFAAA